MNLSILLYPAGFRQVYEPLWLRYGVDLLFSGHVHAYERSNPVAAYSADPSGCAPVQLIVGDGGNHEGVRGLPLAHAAVQMTARTAATSTPFDAVPLRPATCCSPARRMAERSPHQGDAG